MVVLPVAMSGAACTLLFPLDGLSGGPTGGPDARIDATTSDAPQDSQAPSDSGGDADSGVPSARFVQQSSGVGTERSFDAPTRGGDAIITSASAAGCGGVELLRRGAVVRGAARRPARFILQALSERPSMPRVRAPTRPRSALQALLHASIGVPRSRP